MPNLRTDQSLIPNTAGANMEVRMARMEKRQFLVSALCAALVMALLIMIVKRRETTVTAAESQQVLRLKGLVIEDEQGRARILLGSPFPAVADRKRQDATTSAMVFLDEQGHDRFALGEKMAPQIEGAVPANYKSPGTGYGLTLFDPSGNERGEMGFLSSERGGGRAVAVLDRPVGDAIGEIVDDNTGYAGIAALYPDSGNASAKTGILLGTQGNKAFLSMQDTENRPRASLSVEPKRSPALLVFEDDGRPGANLLHSADRAMTDTR